MTPFKGNRGTTIRLLLFAALALPGPFPAPMASPASAGPAPAGAEDLSFTLRRAALQELLAAATPYRVEVGSSLLRESLTFSDPKDLVFQDGKITFAVRCQGTPFPLDQVLRPVLSLRASGNGGYQAVVESLPLKIPGYGAIDLKDVVAPVDIEPVLRQTLWLQDRPAELTVKIRRIVVRAEQIEVGASLSLKASGPR